MVPACSRIYSIRRVYVLSLLARGLAVADLKLSVELPTLNDRALCSEINPGSLQAFPAIVTCVIAFSCDLVMYYFLLNVIC